MRPLTGEVGLYVISGIDSVVVVAADPLYRRWIQPITDEHD